MSFIVCNCDEYVDVGVNVEDTRLGFDMSTKKKWRVDEAFKR